MVVGQLATGGTQLCRGRAEGRVEPGTLGHQIAPDPRESKYLGR